MLGLAIVGLALAAGSIDRVGSMAEALEWLEGRWLSVSYPATGPSRHQEVWTVRGLNEIDGEITRSGGFAGRPARIVSVQLRYGAGGPLFMVRTSADGQRARYRQVSARPNEVVFENRDLDPQRIRYARAGDVLTVEYSPLDGVPQWRTVMDRQ